MAYEALTADAERFWRERRTWSGLKSFVEEQDRAKLLLFLEGHSRVLEMIARSVPLPIVLEELMRVLEEQVDGMACSILLLSEDRMHLRHGAAPSLPDSYTRAIDGLAIGPRAGSCGTAAFLGRPVIVSDIAQDPLWADYKDLALGVGFKACWSTPIISGSGEVLGTFAMYHRRPFAPSSIHLSLIDLATHLARIAIERSTAERERQSLQDAKRFADRYQMVLDATGEAVWDWDLASGVVLWNGGSAYFGYEAAGGEGHTLDWWTERIHQKEVERVRRSLQHAVDSGQTQWQEEYCFRRMDGTFADVVDRGLIVRDNAGNAVRMVGALQDITRRKRHEQEMEELAERFRSATAAAAVGTWRFDLKRRVFLADESLNHMLGGKEEEAALQFDDVIRAVHPEDRSRVTQEIDESIATGRPYNCDHRVVLADGEIRWLHSRGRVLYDVHGSPQGLMGAVADITEIKHAEQSMAILADASRLLAESLDSEQILSTITRMVVPSFSDGVVIQRKDPLTGELRIALVHAANPELLAAARELQESSIRVGAPSRRVMQAGRAELTPRFTPEWLLAQDVDERMVSLIRRFGISSTIHVPLVLAGQPVAVIVFAATGTRVYNARDLAFAEELARRASNAMRNAELFRATEVERERAEEAAEMRERLVAILGHDLRNPLSSINMAAQLLGRSELATAEKRLASRIQTSANRMMRLIDQILDFARIRAGLGFELQIKTADLHEICNVVVDELRLSRPDREIVLNVEGHGEAMCDTDRITQVLSNLIGNAIQHGTRGPITVTARDVPDAVAIEIHNFGPPIPQAAQAIIFDAFHRETTASDRRSTSIGLGLFIADQIVRAHGGSIAVRSPDRNGTTFTVVLPRKPAGIRRIHAESSPRQVQ
jgi:PAS domain S-box-containing protein